MQEITREGPIAVFSSVALNFAQIASPVIPFIVASLLIAAAAIGESKRLHSNPIRHPSQIDAQFMALLHQVLRFSVVFLFK